MRGSGVKTKKGNDGFSRVSRPVPRRGRKAFHLGILEVQIPISTAGTQMRCRWGVWGGGGRADWGERDLEVETLSQRVRGGGSAWGDVEAKWMRMLMKCFL